MGDTPATILELFFVILWSTMGTTAFSTPRPLQEWPHELFISPPVHRLPPYFCQSGANLAEISLDDCGSCYGRCEGLNTMNRHEGLCSCDSACVVYNDCCWDFQQECPELHDRAAAIGNTFDITPNSICFALDDQAGRRDVLLINSCGRTIYDHPAVTGIPDLYTQVPVRDLDTGVFYINLNCAICNGAQRIQAMEVHLNYHFGMNVLVIHRYGETNTTATPAFSTADEVLEAMATTPIVAYSFPGTPARQCQQALVGDCSETCANIDLIDLCRTGGQSYTSMYPGSQIYRNLYCALCNFNQIDQLQCSAYFMPVVSGSEHLSTFSLSFLFDLQELESPSVNSISLHCSTDELDLPDGIVCGATVCPRGYTLYKDTCRADHLSGQLNSAQSVSPCKGVSHPVSAFTMENGSLILTINGHVYNEGEYIMDNASAIICQNITDIDFSANSALGITTIILCSISLLGLICRLILQPLWQQYKSFPGRMQFNLVLAMALAIALLLLSPLASDVDKLCFTLGVLKYYAFLSSFVWMTCVAGDTWWALRRSRICRQKEPNLLRYLLIGWLLPLILTITILSIDILAADTSLAPQFGGRGCWIRRKLPLILFFFVPFFISVTSNIMFFLLTVRFLEIAFLESNVLRKSKDPQHPWHVYLKLFAIMGLTWLIGFVAIWVNSEVVWFLFVILNASQGLFIFMAFVVNFSKVRKMFPCFKLDPSPEMFSSDQTASTHTTDIQRETVPLKARETWIRVLIIM